MLKFLKDLVSSSVNPDKASHTKFWSNIGMASMTAVFVKMGWNGTLPEWYMWVYASAVAAPQLLSNFISLRWGVNVNQGNNNTNSNKGE